MYTIWRLYITNDSYQSVALSYCLVRTFGLPILPDDLKFNLPISEKNSSKMT